MTQKYLVKDSILYRMYKDKWGTYPRYYINFDKLLHYVHKKGVGGKPHQLYINDYRILCWQDDCPLPEHIQQIYTDWCDAEVEKMLTGAMDD